MKRARARSWRLWLALGATVLLTAGLAGCSDSDDGINAESGESFEVSYGEHDFARNPNLRAQPDDTLTLQLEEPSGDAAGADTGDEDGVDVIPYTFAETAERTFCWQRAGETEPDGAPSQMSLIDDASGDAVLEVEEGGECVTATLAAGRYSAVFRNRPSASPERDLVFVVPQHEGASAPAAVAELDDEEPPPPQAAPEEPRCEFAVLTSPTYVPPFLPAALLQLAVVDSAFGLGLYYVAPGGCTDVTLIHDTRPRRDSYYSLTTFPGFKARIYEDLFYRGPRKTVGHLNDSSISYTFVSPASMVLVSGDPEINRIIVVTGGCPACDLSGVDLSDADLRGADLRQTDFSHANLAGAILADAKATQAVFKSAYLHGADLRRADLQSARFDSAGTIDGGDGKIFPAADLTGAKLDEALLVNADLRRATLTEASFRSATMDGADLRGVSADRAGFQSAMLTSAALTNGVFRGAAFDNAHLEDANLQGASLTNARLPNARLDRAQLQKDDDHLAAALDGAYMANAVLNDADLTGVSMLKARFYGGQAQARNAIFDQAQLSGAVLSGANFTGAFFRSASLSEAVCVNCAFNTARLGRTASSLTDAASFLGVDLRGADFTQATVDGCNFNGALISLDERRVTYSYGSSPDVRYTAQYGASKVGPLRASDTVRCPSSALGPCDDEKLTAAAPTLTMTPRPPTATATARPATSTPVAG